VVRRRLHQLLRPAGAPARRSRKHRAVTRSMGGAVSSVMTAPGRQIFQRGRYEPPRGCSSMARFHRPVNTANIFISYYTYGQAIALGTDLAIRAQFPGKSLDDWMRAMWREHPDTQKPTRSTICNRRWPRSQTGIRRGALHQPVYARSPWTMRSCWRAPASCCARLHAAGVDRRAGLHFFRSRRRHNHPTLRGSPLYDAGSIAATAS